MNLSVSRGLLLCGVALVVMLFTTIPVQAQCSHLGQTVNCPPGAPTGTGDRARDAQDRARGLIEGGQVDILKADASTAGTPKPSEETQKVEEKKSSWWESLIPSIGVGVGVGRDRESDRAKEIEIPKKK